MRLKVGPVDGVRLKAGPVDAMRLKGGPVDHVRLKVGPVDRMKLKVRPVDPVKLKGGPVDHVLGGSSLILSTVRILRYSGSFPVCWFGYFYAQHKQASKKRQVCNWLA